MLENDAEIGEVRGEATKVGEKVLFGVEDRDVLVMIESARLCLVVIRMRLFVHLGMITWHLSM